MKFRKRMEITKRGYRLLHTYTPGLIRAKTVSAVIEGLFPFVSIWFSAQIINELMREKTGGIFRLYTGHNRNSFSFFHDKECIR